MSSAKKLLYTVAAGMVAGAVLGVLYAPADGAETRKRISRLKKRFSCGCCADEMDEDKETLEELSAALQKELDRINKKLEQL